MAYRHGVIVSEVPTSVLPPVEVSAAIPIRSASTSRFLRIRMKRPLPLWVMCRPPL